MLAVLVALFAIPLLILDSPAVAGSLETTSAPIESQNAVAPDADDTVDENAVNLAEAIDAVAERTDGLAEAAEVFVSESGVAADEEFDVNISEILAQGFATFSVPESGTDDADAVAAAIADAAASIEAEAAEAAATDDADEADEPSEEQSSEEPAEVEADEPVEVEAEAEVTAAAEEPVVTEEAAEQPVEEAAPVESVEPAPVEVEEEVEAPEAALEAPATPPQVDGRVPPPADGPTAAQWDALRTCESTNNYSALNPSGKFRGAYQFSVETWDWVASIHWPHLVGVDPAAAEPAWQDVMAYTLFSMRGWNQWPECGRHLL